MYQLKRNGLRNVHFMRFCLTFFITSTESRTSGAMAFKRSAVRSRLSPPRNTRFRKKSGVFFTGLISGFLQPFSHFPMNSTPGLRKNRVCAQAQPATHGCAAEVTNKRLTAAESLWDVALLHSVLYNMKQEHKGRRGNGHGTEHGRL